MASKPEISLTEGDIKVGKASKVVYRTATDANGKKVRIRILDATSETFTADFLASFRANVVRARKENRNIGVKA